MNDIRTIIIPPDGPGALATIDADDIGTYQGIVGGYLEAVYADHDADGRPQVMLFCNDEGKLAGMTANTVATRLWHALDAAMAGRDSLCGTVIVTGAPDPDGRTTDVPDHVVALWRELG